MSRMGCFVWGLAVGAGLVFGALKYHLVHAPDGVHLVPKVTAGFEDSYVDIRAFGLDEWNEHRSLSLAIVKAGKGELIGTAAGFQLRESLEAWLDGLYGDQH